MTEIELKFQVPEHTRQAVAAAVMTEGARRTRLQAIYFDTPDRRLASAGIAVRLRKEGPRWVQTLKAGGPHAMERLEHNVPLADIAEDALPALDLQRHGGTAAAALLARALAPGGGEPVPRPVALYRTDIWRSHRTHRVPDGVVELAFDEGAILAEDRRWPVCELEIELVEGSAATVIEVARHWVDRHGLWLDVRSKAERGDRLARKLVSGPAHRATREPLQRGAAAEAGLRQAVSACLPHLLPNASEVAAGASTPEQRQQLYRGLRRLGAALRLFHGSTEVAAAHWAPVLSALRREFVVLRDRQAAAGPGPLACSEEAAQRLRATPVTHCLLDLQMFAMAPAASGAIEAATSSAG